MMEALQKDKNPYTLQFSYLPPQYIERKVTRDEIVGNFIRDIPTYRGFFISGVRGCGKTVLLSDISNRIRENDAWIVVNVEDPESDIISTVVHHLYHNLKIRKNFLNIGVEFAVGGFTVKLDNSEKVHVDERDVLKLILEELKKNKKKLLITIDEVTLGNNLASFSHFLSSYAMEGYEIYLLMTGLMENIKEIRNQKSLTFLYRAGLKELEPLNVTAIMLDYKKTLGITKEQAEKLAYITKGYSFAFQVLGNIYWDCLCSQSSFDDIDEDEVLLRMDQVLAEQVYDKIWSELSEKSKEILKNMSEISENRIKVEDIRKTGNYSSNEFTVYREMLIKRGIIKSDGYGYLTFNLPRMKEYVDRQFRAY